MMSNLYQLSPVFHRTKASDIGVVDSMAFAKAHMHMKRHVDSSQVRINISASVPFLETRTALFLRKEGCYDEKDAVSFLSDVEEKSLLR